MHFSHFLSLFGRLDTKWKLKSPPKGKSKLISYKLSPCRLAPRINGKRSLNDFFYVIIRLKRFPSIFFVNWLNSGVRISTSVF